MNNFQIIVAFCSAPRVPCKHSLQNCTLSGGWTGGYLLRPVGRGRGLHVPGTAAVCNTRRIKSGKWSGLAFPRAIYVFLKEKVNARIGHSSYLPTYNNLFSFRRKSLFFLWYFPFHFFLHYIISIA